MEPGNFPRKFDIEDAKGQPSRPVIEEGTVEPLDGLEIWDADDPTLEEDRWASVEIVTGWIPISTERTWHHITLFFRRDTGLAFYILYY